MQKSPAARPAIRNGAPPFTGPVTFTGGALLDSIPSTTGSDAFTLAVRGDGFSSSDGYLSAFSANITGSLTAPVPLPPQFWPGMFVLGAVVLTPAICRRLREHAMMRI